MKVYQANKPMDYNLAELRMSLWPHLSLEEHIEELEKAFDTPSRFTVFIVSSPEGKGVGFAEVTIRYDYVNGCKSSPVSFLEGIYVAPQYRRQGLARLLCNAVEDWICSKGYHEFASDALLDNKISHKMHASLGFKETERVVYFKKDLKG